MKDKELHKKVDRILFLMDDHKKINIAAKVHILWTAGLFLSTSVIALLIRAFILK